MTLEDSGLGDYCARELVLAAAARIVLAAFGEPVEDKRLTPSARATLRVLEAALDPYPSGPLDDPDK